MRKADMKKAMEAGTPVAVGKVYSYEAVPFIPLKAEIVGLEQPRKVHGRGGFYGHDVYDGVLVRGYRGDDLIVRVVGPREVFNTWDEYERLAALVAERKRRQYEQTENRTQRAAEALKQLRRLGYQGNLDFRRSDGYPVGITVDLESAEQIVTLLQEFEPMEAA